MIFWTISRKCNHWVKLPDATITVFRAKDKVRGSKQERWGWRCVIVRSAKEGPLFGTLLHADVEAAKKAAIAKYKGLGGRLEETVENPISTQPEGDRDEQ